MQQAGTGGGTAVLFLTHYVNSAIVARFRTLQRALAGRHDVFFAVHLASSKTERQIPRDLVGPRLFCFTTAMLRRLPYPRARDWQGESLVPGRVDLCLQLFRRLHPAYERFYQVENDVVFRGDWRTLFAELDASPADLLATNIFRQDENPGWYHWPGLQVGDLPPERRLRAFCPFCRLSRRALLATDAYYRRGWSGHFEGLIPTILLAEGLTIEDIGGEGPFVPPGRERRYYWSDRLKSEGLAPGSFVFRPLQTPTGAEPWLWHPVKIAQRRDLWHRLRCLWRGHLRLDRLLREDERYRRLEELLAL